MKRLRNLIVVALLGVSSVSAGLQRLADGRSRLTAPQLKATFACCNLNVYTDAIGDGTDAGRLFLECRFVSGVVDGQPLRHLHLQLPEQASAAVSILAVDDAGKVSRHDLSPPLTRAQALQQMRVRLVAQPHLPPNIRRVGFDIDDTLLLSSPAFTKAFKSGVGREGEEPFWTLVNSLDRELSEIKESVRTIVKQHLQQGCEVYAVTARKPHGGELLQAFIEAEFAIPADHVYFAPDEKTERIVELGLDVFYGDADTDISEAMEAGAYPVRILRSHLSTYRQRQGKRAGFLKKYRPGCLGEEILEGTDR